MPRAAVGLVALSSVALLLVCALVLGTHDRWADMALPMSKRALPTWVDKERIQAKKNAMDMAKAHRIETEWAYSYSGDLGEQLMMPKTEKLAISTTSKYAGLFDGEQLERKRGSEYGEGARP